MTAPALTKAESAEGHWVGRIWKDNIGPCVVTVRNNELVDITSRRAPTVRDLLELPDVVNHLRYVPGEVICGVNEHALLAPCDLQAIKAAGVTFARSMVERVIEEQAAGDPDRASAIRDQIGRRIGQSLQDIVPGSAAAAEVKEELSQLGLWSQYLEVGIGSDAEIFSKAQALASVGHGAEVGLHPISKWNNPEPEIVLAVTSRGEIKGATLGNDVNLRDVEGRSALLLSKAKDNNASCAIGPMIRVFDDMFTLEDVRQAKLDLSVKGNDGYILSGASSMREISRDPVDLVAQTIGRHHQYPDGFMLFLGTLFAPTEDRDEPGQGFTHKLGDVVQIRCNGLGTLENTVTLSTDAPEWTFGLADLMRNLAGRGLL